MVSVQKVPIQWDIFVYVGDDVFYCYYERVAERRMWFFFIRHFGTKEVTLAQKKT